MTKVQRKRRWHGFVLASRKFLGAHPLAIVSLLLTLFGGIYHEWRAGVERIAGLERDVTNLSAVVSTQRAELRSDLGAEADRLRRMIARRCAEVCDK